MWAVTVFFPGIEVIRPTENHTVLCEFPEKKTYTKYKVILGRSDIAVDERTLDRLAAGHMSSLLLFFSAVGVVRVCSLFVWCSKAAANKQKQSSLFLKRERWLSRASHRQQNHEASKRHPRLSDATHFVPFSGQSSSLDTYMAHR